MEGLNRVTPATLDVLEVLLDQSVEHYGFMIAKSAHLPTGSVFPILARLERVGWVTSYWEDIDPDSRGARRRFYRLSADGVRAARQVLAERRGHGLSGKLAWDGAL